MIVADHSDRGVEDMKFLHLRKHWDRAFESHSRYVCLPARVSSVIVSICIGSGLATGLMQSKGSYWLLYTRKVNTRLILMGTGQKA
jgi:hypothetical protein